MSEVMLDQDEHILYARDRNGNTVNVSGGATVGDRVLFAQDVCPHIFELLEEAAASGFINASEWGRRIKACETCKRDLLALLEASVEGISLPGAMGFMVRQTLSALISKAHELADDPH